MAFNSLLFRKKATVGAFLLALPVCLSNRVFAQDYLRVCRSAAGGKVGVSASAVRTVPGPETASGGRVLNWTARLEGSLVSGHCVVDVKSGKLVWVEVGRYVPVSLGGTARKIINGSINGYDTVNYVVNGQAGRKLAVKLETMKYSTYFNITAPGDTALHDGAVDGNNFAAALPTTGDYRITVYQMRNAARGNTSAPFELTVSMDGQ